MAPEAPEERLTLEQFLGRPEWHRQASCTGATPTFFSSAPGNFAKAQALCEGCLVRQECLEVALGDSELPGMWGATTEAGRRALRRAVA